jgi:hypothetical protein
MPMCGRTEPEQPCEAARAMIEKMLADEPKFLEQSLERLKCASRPDATANTRHSVILLITSKQNAAGSNPAGRAISLN